MVNADAVGAGMLGEDRFISPAAGRRLRIMVAGTGDDLVVLEAGLGISGLYWGPVHEALAGEVRVIAYERAGYGASTPDSHPRDLARLIADLQQVIGAVPHRRLVLVGHSWGGPIVRGVAARMLADGSPPAGLVLVDPSDEHAPSLSWSRAVRWSNTVQAASMVPLARLRLLSPLTAATLQELAPPLRDAVVTASASVTAARATADELKHVADDLFRLSTAPPDLGDLPLCVISGAKTTWLDKGLRTRLIAAHRQTVGKHPGARHVLTHRSGHTVPTIEPGLVASEALRLLG
ncbi:MAG: alpha/beta hydrolase [Propioniciclava sp.]|uniref:alpha/beta fold hydrolase n=1 Tax=Propioniciclava sp. TaxID=2038686 RepID=UPI0039E4E745